MLLLLNPARARELFSESALVFTREPRDPRGEINMEIDLYRILRILQLYLEYPPTSIRLCILEYPIGALQCGTRGMPRVRGIPSYPCSYLGYSCL